MAMAFTVVMLAGAFQNSLRLLEAGSLHHDDALHRDARAFMSGIGNHPIILQIGPFLARPFPRRCDGDLTGRS